MGLKIISIKLRLQCDPCSSPLPLGTIEAKKKKKGMKKSDTECMGFPLIRCEMLAEMGLLYWEDRAGKQIENTQCKSQSLLSQKRTLHSFLQFSQCRSCSPSSGIGFRVGGI